MIVNRDTMQSISETGMALTCCHHWIIETANGPISRGVCRNCFESREFKNSVFDIERDANDLPVRTGAIARETDGARDD